MGRSMPPDPDHRRRLGAAGEQCAADYLAARGYNILERNYRRKWGEADIVALAPDGTHVIVEVRSRSNPRYVVEAAQSVGPRKQQQLRRLAHGLMAEHEADIDIRVDLIVVSTDRSGRLAVAAHIEHAIEDD
ncbi:MAG: YraN family protein [Chloroflexi bacterium]|nr:YraN family protein [Chloroflexota bacterium]